MPAVQLGSFVDRTDLGAAFCKVIEKFLANFSVGHFSAAEADGHLNSVAVCEKLECALELDVKVIGTDAGGHSDFLDLDDLLILLRLLLALGLLETELAIVHYLAYRRGGVG